MLVALLSEERELAAAGQDIVRLIYPGVQVVLEPKTDADITVFLSAAEHGSEIAGTARLEPCDGQSALEETATGCFCRGFFTPGDARNQRKRLVKLALFRILSRFSGKAPGPWGILTGIRPTKIVHRLMDQACENEAVTGYLVCNYDMAREKALMLAEIAAMQRGFLLSGKEAKEKVSIYIGIPFCPSRCVYCSFPSYVITKHAHLLNPFLQALQREITEIGRALEGLGKTVQTLYIGGGTPTVLNNGQLASLLESVSMSLASGATVEITLEAGRPDTITREKLITAIEAGVTRLSINPQSMNRQTLERIGRQHTPEQVVEAVEMAREVGFRTVNMDLIIGLPGESSEDVMSTLNQIEKLRAENLTVHTLAVKRASAINEARGAYTLPSAVQVEHMLEKAANTSAQMGMHPYYLYRQKQMVGPLENLGYSLPGHECIYNIQIIEERQTILGLGGGAGSKFVHPETLYLSSMYNPKDPENYIIRIDELIERKISSLRQGPTLTST